jgi:uncharacterized protein (TIGR00299 family) protein
LKIAYFDCFSGASGDMLLGSLLDAGLSLDQLRADLARLGIGGYQLEARPVTRHGLSGTHLRVRLSTEDRPARTLPNIQRILSDSTLPDSVKTRSLRVFTRLAGAEARVHGTTIDQIHFHELGAVDSLVDIVGFVCALDRLGIEAVHSSPLTLGGGTVQTEHGRLPAPAPATLALLAEVGAPTTPGPAMTELLTPTGAALLTEFATFARPAMTVQAVGYGFGTKEFDWPNALRVWLGKTLPVSHLLEEDRVVRLSCNLDDATGETLAYAREQLLAAGALDAWFAPIQMKKGRPGTMLSVLCRPDDAAALAALILRETPTLGVRYHTESRFKASRETRQVDTPWGAVRVKLKRLGEEIVSASPEYEDCAALARGAGLPLAEVMEAARAAASQSKPHIS